MIDRRRLLNDLKPLLRELEADLRARCDEASHINEGLQKEYAAAKEAKRIGVSFEEWRADLITQVAVAWVLSCVFVRFLEDNSLISPPRISGLVHDAPKEGGLARSRDEWDLYLHQTSDPTHRGYLLKVFADLAKLPGAKDVFGAHNPVTDYPNWLSGDAAQKLIAFFQKIDVEGVGEIVHDFTDPQWDTRFLGDLYQDLSEAARKKYALLQTPIFVEEFILERTLEPAIVAFGRTSDELKAFKMIDPACGSGHFLLGAFARLLDHWRRREPGENPRELVNRAMAAVHGVDLNPYAIAIARFRLLLVAMRECEVSKLADAPAFAFNLACGDSLLHGKPGQQSVMAFDELAHAYQAEDLKELKRILTSGAYHAVVANPPYITVKDKALNQAYRDRYPEVCHRQYSIAVPFTQRLVDLTCPNGFTGQITANSFMKREFGKKLIESYLPKWDLTHVIDTSGAYIPGHGTPTVILFGRNRKPFGSTIRTAMGIAGEPATPEDPANGLVWTAIVDQLDRAGSQSRYISVNDSPREAFHKHPWSIGGGGAAELKEMLDEGAATTLCNQSSEIGRTTHIGEDETLLLPVSTAREREIADWFVEIIDGELVRDYVISAGESVFFPYDRQTANSRLDLNHQVLVFLWPNRVLLRCRQDFGNTIEQRGLRWFDHSMFFPERYRKQLGIAFGEVASHNHFVLDRGGKVFNRTAPVIKLPAEATEEDHLALLGLLNCSTACFWLRQVCFPKGGDHVGQEGARVRKSIWDERHAFNASNMEEFPLPSGRPLDSSRRIDALARSYAETLPNMVCRRVAPDAATLARAREQAHHLRGQMIALQEELDWECYGLYGLIPAEGAGDFKSPAPENLPSLELGQRAFEIVLARQMATGEVETTWFTRHGSTPITEIPEQWPAEYRALVQRRIELIESDRNIGLIEKPEYKRRWNTEPWEEQQARALKGWLLDQLESYFDLDGRMNDAHTITASGVLREPRLTSIAKIADLARADRDFMQVAEIYAGRIDFDVGVLVGELIANESVPVLPVLRYKPAAMDKRKAWERTWDLQRKEDAIDSVFELTLLQRAAAGDAEKILQPVAMVLAINEEAKTKVLAETMAAAAHVKSVVAQKGDVGIELDQLKIKDAAARAKKAAVGDIPVPPKYTSADFLSGHVWRLRGKLDVPKERWVSFPHCEGQDGTLVIAWAGYDHLQLARAVAERYELAKEQEGRRPTALLAAIGQLIPWLKQWHNEFDPVYSARMGDFFANYLEEEAKALGLSVDEVKAWTPPEKVKAVKAKPEKAKREKKPKPEASIDEAPKPPKPRKPRAKKSKEEAVVDVGESE
jgi:hypothetical protein